MPWDVTLGRWVTILAPRCVGCDQVVWLDAQQRCSDCALYDDGGQETPVADRAVLEEEWYGVA